jgi:predicted DNA-binding transcriptional regulator YafY
MRYERLLGVTSRLESLLDLIREGSYSTPSLAAKLQVCDQTIYRDILFLRQRGYRIRSRRLSNGWIYELLDSPEAGSCERGEGL